MGHYLAFTSHEKNYRNKLKMARPIRSPQSRQKKKNILDPNCTKNITTTR